MKEKISIRDFAAFCNENLKYIIAYGFVFFICYYKLIFSGHFYADCGVVMNFPKTTYNWLDIGRFGLVLVRKIFGTDWYNPYFEAAILVIGMMLACTIWMYFFKNLYENISMGCLMIFSLLFTIYPMFVEQFYFQFQSFEFSVGISLIGIALICVYNGIENKKKLSYVWAGMAMIVSFGIYQSFVNLYLCGGIVFFVFLTAIKKYASEEKIVKDNACKMLFFGGHFIIVFVIYQILIKSFFSSSTYLSSQVMWGKKDFSQIINELYEGIRTIFLGESNYYTNSLMICAIIVFAVIVYLFFQKQKILTKLLQAILLLGLLLSPFLLDIYMGTVAAIRAHVMVPFVSAFIIMLALIILSEKKNKYYLGIMYVCAGLIILMQFSDTTRLVYTYDTISKNDEKTAYQIEERIYALDGYEKEMPVVFIGHLDGKVNGSAFKSIGDAMTTTSSFTMHYTLEPYFYWSSHHINSFYQMLGIQFATPTEEEVNIAKEYVKDKPVWPASDCVMIYNSIVIVHLSDVEEIFQ